MGADTGPRTRHIEVLFSIVVGAINLEGYQSERDASSYVLLTPCYKCTAKVWTRKKIQTFSFGAKMDIFVSTPKMGCFGE
jgi:hypothetical protein